MKNILIALAALTLAAPAMAGGDSAEQLAKREAKWAAEQAKNCEEALERYAEQQAAEGNDPDT